MEGRTLIPSSAFPCRDYQAERMLTFER